MSHRLILGVIISLFPIGAAAKPSARQDDGASAATKPIGVLLNIDHAKPGMIKKLYSKVSNLTKDSRFAKHQPKIEVLFNSKGYLYTLKNLSDSEQGILKKLKDEFNADLLVCGNTLKKYKISMDKVNLEIAPTPSAIGEIILRQASGWAYINLSL